MSHLLILPNLAPFGNLSLPYFHQPPHKRSLSKLTKRTEPWHQSNN